MGIHDLTKNHMKNQVLYLIASTGRIDRDDLRLLDISEAYLSKVIFELKAEGLINVSATRPTVQTLTPKGIELLWQDDRGAYDFFMRVTNGNHLSGDKKQRVLQKKVAQTTAMMYASGAMIGDLKPTLMAVKNDLMPELEPARTYFYLNREIKHELNQKESRQQMSRSTGILLAPAIRAVVYNLLDQQMFLAKRTESMAHVLLDVSAKGLYGMIPAQQKKVSLVLCQNDKCAAEIFLREAKRGDKKGIGDAVQSRGFTGTDFHYVPIRKVGVKIMNIITKHLDADLWNILYEPEEIYERAVRNSLGEAIVNGRYSYEFLRGNVSKLHRIRQVHKDMSEVEIVAFEEQCEFLSEFFGEKQPQMRAISTKDWDRKVDSYYYEKLIEENLYRLEGGSK